jgi:hypothetical protein
MDKKQVATSTAAGGGGAGIVSQWDTIGSMEWIGDLMPLMVLVTYLALFAVGYLVLDLHKRVKALEAR